VLARAIAVSSGATIGLHRFSLTQLAARLAAPILASQGLAPVTYLGSEAVAARATFEAQRDAALAYFAPVAKTPGFPRALARTLPEPRLAVPIDSAAELAFVKTLLGLRGSRTEDAGPDEPRTSHLDPRTSILVTVPFGDIGTMDRLKSLGLERELLEQAGDTDLVALRR